jgi:hypothetical protein
MRIVEQDPWLKPVSQAVTERYLRFKGRLQELEQNYGSLKAFATADKLFGFNYDSMRKGWWFREWAPGASQLFIMGDFNNWNKYGKSFLMIKPIIPLWFMKACISLLCNLRLVKMKGFLFMPKG